MQLRFGPYAGKSTEVLLLRAPDYADWVLSHRPDGALGRDFSHLIAAFDARPLEQACACGAPASRVRAYANSTDLLVLCEDCAAQPALGGVTSEVTAYAGALGHVRETCVRAHRKAQRRIIRRLASAKGLPRRITQASAEAFLCGLCAAPPRRRQSREAATTR
jgi:hypothetical protein